MHTLMHTHNIPRIHPHFRTLMPRHLKPWQPTLRDHSCFHQRHRVNVHRCYGLHNGTLHILLYIHDLSLPVVLPRLSLPNPHNHPGPHLSRPRSPNACPPRQRILLRPPSRSSRRISAIPSLNARSRRPRPST